MKSLDPSVLVGFGAVVATVVEIPIVLYSEFRCVYPLVPSLAKAAVIENVVSGLLESRPLYLCDRIPVK